MNCKILLLVFVIFCTTQVSHSVEIGTGCKPAIDFHEELKHLTYIIRKSSRPTNCFRYNFNTVVKNIYFDNCSNIMFDYIATKLEKITVESGIPIEQTYKCHLDVYDHYTKIFDKMNSESNECQKGSDDVLQLLYNELEKVHEKTTNYENTVDKTYKKCYFDFGGAQKDHDKLYACLTDLVVQSTAETKELVNDNESIPKQFGNLADEATDQFRQCCIQLHPSWTVLADGVVDEFQKCVDEIINSNN